MENITPDTDKEEILELLPEVQFLNKLEMTKPETYKIKGHSFIDDQFKDRKKLVLHIKSPNREGLIDVNIKNRNFLINKFSGKTSTWKDQSLTIYSKLINTDGANGYTLIFE